MKFRETEKYIVLKQLLIQGYWRTFWKYAKYLLKTHHRIYFDKWNISWESKKSSMYYLGFLHGRFALSLNEGGWPANIHISIGLTHIYFFSYLFFRIFKKNHRFWLGYSSSGNWSPWLQSKWNTGYKIWKQYNPHKELLDEL